MKITVVTMPEIPVVYLRRIGPYDENNRNLMERLKNWAREQGLLETGVILGVAWDDPVRTPPDQCRYDVCLALEDHFPKLEADMAPGRLPGGCYACFQGAHTPSGVQALWKNSFAALAEQGLAPDPDRPVLERYRPKLLEQGLCELCIPV